MGIRGIPIPLIAEPQFSALPYPYAKKGQPSNRLAVLSRFQGCSGGGKLPMVSWETAAPVCGLLRGPLPRRPGMGAALTPVQKRNRHFPPGPTHTLKKTLKKDSQAIAWLSFRVFRAGQAAGSCQFPAGRPLPPIPPPLPGSSTGRPGQGETFAAACKSPPRW